MACSTGEVIVVVEAKMKKHTVNVQEINTVEVLVSMRNLGGSPNYGCQYYHMVH